MLYDAIKRVSPGYYQHDIQAHWNIFKSSGDNPTAIPQDTLPLDMLTPQIRHYELCQKYSRSANFSDFFTPSYAIFDFVKKKSRLIGTFSNQVGIILHEKSWILRFFKIFQDEKSCLLEILINVKCHIPYARHYNLLMI